MLVLPSQTRISQPFYATQLASKNCAFSFNFAKLNRLDAGKRGIVLSPVSPALVTSYNGEGVTVSGINRAYLNTIDNPLQTSKSDGTGDFLIVGSLNPTASGTSSAPLHIRRDSAPNYETILIRCNSYYNDNDTSGTVASGYFYIGEFNASNGNARGVFSSNAVNGSLLNFAYSRVGSTRTLFINSKKIGTSVYAPASISTTGQLLSIGGWATATGLAINYPLYLMHAENRGASDAELFSLSKNPWQIFQPDRNSIYFNFAAAGIDLASNAQSSSTATGDIAQSTALSASAISEATATGQITQSTSLSANASGVATATGDVSTGVPGTALAGSATASATATGALSQATALTGGASAIVTASGTVNDLTPKLAGNAVSTATASATFFSELKRVTSYRYAPGVVPEDLPSLVRFLQLELYNIKSGLDSVADGHLDKSYTAPYKPSDGDIRYADGSYWNPGSGPGIYRYNGSAWVFLG